jgi:hypothetical protein
MRHLGPNLLCVFRVIRGCFLFAVSESQSPDRYQVCPVLLTLQS